MRGKQTSSTSSSSSHGGVISLGERPKNQQRQDSTIQKRSSYLISITIPQPKIRIKIPKLVANTMCKPFFHGERSNCNDESPKTKTKTTSFSKPRKLLHSTKVGSIFTGVFFRNKNKKQNPPGDSTSRRIRSSTDNCLDSENPEEFSRVNSGSTVKEEERKKRWNAPTMACKLTWKVLPPASKKKVGVGNGNGVSSSVMIGRRGSSGKLTRVSSRAVQSRGSLRKLGVKKLVTEEKDGTGSGFELCKKRILMGGKCKPLNISGTLQYDQNGILRPDPEPEADVHP
ncbi:hypothetical protein PanWU01x14_105980 [Parasponia andersonii]|uniref:Uncharacterized protein n=1 Tax=Parasponia andersonii TaxID=3476 RepID=A0A2P5D146_PARAD|nr:hypothetical protein PanWU01x14_105980 [Parasponia andersonii]